MLHTFKNMYKPVKLEYAFQHHGINKNQIIEDDGTLPIDLLIEHKLKDTTNLKDIDTSNVTSFKSAFSGQPFNFDISQLDFSNAYCVSSMLRGCYRFNHDISKCNFSDKLRDNDGILMEAWSYNYPLVNHQVLSTRTQMWDTLPLLSHDLQLWLHWSSSKEQIILTEDRLQRNIRLKILDIADVDVNKENVNNAFQIALANGMNTDDIEYEVRHLYISAGTPLIMKHNLWTNKNPYTQYGRRLWSNHTTKNMYLKCIPPFVTKLKSATDYWRTNIYRGLETQTLFCSNEKYEFRNSRKNK